MIMPEKISPTLFAPCGMNCLVCYQHCFHPKPCPGCTQDGTGKPRHCRQCAIAACAKEKGLDCCFACALFPCQRLKTLDQRYRRRYRVSLIENGETARQVGVAPFLDQQRQRYLCPACGGVISLHDQMCSVCRRPIGD